MQKRSFPITHFNKFSQLSAEDKDMLSHLCTDERIEHWFHLSRNWWWVEQAVKATSGVGAISSFLNSTASAAVVRHIFNHHGSIFLRVASTSEVNGLIRSSSDSSLRRCWSVSEFLGLPVAYNYPSHRPVFIVALSRKFERETSIEKQVGLSREPRINSTMVFLSPKYLTI